MNVFTNLAILLSVVSFILCIQENFISLSEYYFSKIHFLLILNF